MHRHYTKKPIEERFWRRVKKTSTCWLWIGGTGGRGYGYFWIDGSMRAAHSVALELKLGRPLKEGMQANHNCPNNNHLCVRHVYEGTQKQNMSEDREREGTIKRGEKSWWLVRLTENQVKEIKKSNNGVYGQQTKLARRFKVTHSTIRDIWDESTWSHLNGS